MIASVTHPGPANDARLELVPCAGRPVALTLRAGRPLEDAVGEAMAEAGLDSAWLEIAEAPVSRLDYVIPALSPDADHVAWYSDIRALGGPGRIDRLGMVVGTHDGASFLHGHGLWTPDGGRQAMESPDGRWLYYSKSIKRPGLPESLPGEGEPGTS